MNGFKSLIYKTIKENAYLINEYGDIYSLLRKRKLAYRLDKDGYKACGFQCSDGKRRTFRIATLVLITYKNIFPEYMADPTVNHIDGNKLNNHYSNLEWMERSQNSSERLTKLRGELNPSVVLTENQVIEICELLLKEELSLREIAQIYNVEKSTISHIRRKKTWDYLTKDYNFTKRKMKNKEESKLQREYILQCCRSGIKASRLVKEGYPSTVVYRYYKRQAEQ